MLSGDHTCGPRHRAEKGFTLLVVLAAMFLLALATQKVMGVVSQQGQREREAELLRIGSEVIRAIGIYHEQSPGTVKGWPPSLDALTDDRRFASLQRHLRRAYQDPITRSDDWGFVLAPGGGISGIYSKSEAQPIRVAGAELAELGLGAAQRYSDWKFVYTPKSNDDPNGTKP